MERIASAVSAEASSPHLYKRMESEQIAELILEVFQGLQDASVEGVKMTGSSNGVWLATLFWSVLQDDTSIFVGEKLIKGGGNTKLTLVLGPQENQTPIESDGPNTMPWKLQMWRKEGGLTQFVVFEDLSNIWDELPTPIKIAKFYIQETRFSQVERKRRVYIMNALGEFSGGLVNFLHTHGKIHIQKPFCEHHKSSDKELGCAIVSLNTLITQEWMDCYPKTLTNYGWDADIEEGSNRAFRLLEREFCKPSPKKQRRNEPIFGNVPLGDLSSLVSC